MGLINNTVIVSHTNKVMIFICLVDCFLTSDGNVTIIPIQINAKIIV